jgi:hypothetical protein
MTMPKYALNRTVSINSLLFLAALDGLARL